MGRNLVNTDRAGRKLSTRAVILTLLLAAICLGLVILGLRWWTSYQQSITDRSLFTGVPCAPPCWQGITPDETTAQEAMQILQASPYLKQESIEKTGSYTLGAIWAYWKGDPGGVAIDLRDSLVYRITLNTPYALTLGEVVEEFGSPEALVATLSGIPEHPWWRITLFYPSRGMLCGVGDERFVDPVLKPSTPVETIILVAPRSSLEELLANLGEEDYLEYTRSWRGYGRVFDIYYDSPQDALR